MLLPSLQIILIIGTRLCLAASPLNLLESGIRIFLFDRSNQKDHKTNSFNHKNEFRKTKEEKELKYLYGKPIADRTSVIDSLFEINAKEIIGTPKPQSSRPPIQNDEEETDSSAWSIFQDINFLPLVNDNHISDENKFHLDKNTVDYLDSIRGEVWGQFKSILISYINNLDSSEYSDHQIKDSLPVKMFLKFLDMGDNINIIHLLGKKIDPAAASFLIEKLKESTPELHNLMHAFETNITAVMPHLNDMVNKFSWMSLRHIIDNLIIRVNNTYTKGEIDSYIEDLEKTNSIAAKGLKFVLNLPPETPIYDEKGEGRSFSDRNEYGLKDRDGYGYQEYDVYRDDGYGDKNRGYGDHGSYDGGGHYGGDHHGGGHYGGDHHGGGYHEGSHYVGHKLDPYLILAGIGTAALLTFVAFRVLQTTPMAGKRRKRTVDQLDNELTAHVTHSIDKGYRLYGENFETDAEDVIEGINTLWKKEENKCQRCLLHDILVERMIKNENFKLIMMSAIGQIFGVKKSGQLLDQITNDVFNGVESPCKC